MWSVRAPRVRAWLLRGAALVLTLVALTSVVAVVRGSFGELEGKILTSAAMILLATGIAAVGADARARGAGGLAGPIAAGLGGLAAGAGLIVVWPDAGVAGSWLPRVMASAAVAAVAFGLHAGLAAWARRPRWIVASTILIGYLTAAQAIVIIAWESATDVQVRLLAASAIVLVLGMVLIPVLALASRPERRRDANPI